ncbi:response regulator [Tahibacter amnicola]|uniref:Response regulator n=1 Tax=Tahibacter amnicola TaxID=2976241 RepID=A0ABY6BE94_9GAMM|nr:response regulator [Tahibacter amnicola]UXI66670.1 response regulator [Tahibacter amnicola]
MSAPERALRQRLDTFVGEWRTHLGQSWDSGRAGLLHEELERISEEAENLGVADIADPALELTVFLCSFAATGATPSAAQRQAMATMIDQLAPPPAKEVARPVKRAPVADIRGTAFYLCPPGREIEGLPPYLGSQRYVVRPFSAPEAMVSAFAEATPDLLLVEDSYVPQLHNVLEALARTREAHREPPVCIVLAEAADAARMLFAQRAGADAVVSSRDPVAIFARMEEALEQRRNLGYRVLVVEDDPAQAKFCESILRHRGISTKVCPDVASVIPTLRTFNADLVLLDFYLPDGNGIEVAQSIRQEPGFAFLPIVFLSGEQDLDRRFDAISMGGDDFILKPVKPRHLLMSVDSRVRRARALATSTGSNRGERRGILSGREVFVQELQNLIDKAGESCSALVYIGVDDIEALRERISFVDVSTLSQQLAAALASDLPFARPLCAYGEFAFLAIAQKEDELAMRDALTAARERLVARTWLSSDDPLNLTFTLTAQRITTISRVEQMIRRLRQSTLTAQASGGNCVLLELRDTTVASEDPRVRLVRAILRTPADTATTVLEYQPLVPLTGNLTEQYIARMRLKPPRTSQAILIDADEYLPLARSQGLLTQADRRQVRLALRSIQAAAAGKPDLRVFLRLSSEALTDSSFAPWLATELRSQNLQPGVVALEFSVLDLLDSAPSDNAIETLQRVGSRLCLRMDDDSERAQRWLSHTSFGLLQFNRPAPVAKGSPWSGLANNFARSKSMGKIIIASGVDDVQDIGEVLKLGAHYASGAVLCDWLVDFHFDFAQAVL